jgi:hypothetical protein
MAVAASSESSVQQAVVHRVVAIEQDRYHGWPANNGVWSWGNEILVGFTQGDYLQSTGHSIAGREDSRLARSLDGGETWEAYDPENYLDDGHVRYRGGGAAKVALKEAVDFADSRFAMRIFADGYHGSKDPRGGFFYSYDRGKTWKGPFKLNGLGEVEGIKGQIITARTEYLVQGKRHGLIFITVKYGKKKQSPQRIGCIETTDGGLTFGLVGWVTAVPAKGKTVMPSVVQIDDKTFVLACRRIFKTGGGRCGIELYISRDGCKTWQFLSEAKDTHPQSNPPALVKLKDGRLCVAYGDRLDKTIKCRYSGDQGKTWGPEIVIRDDYLAKHDGDVDLGYVRMVERPDGKLVGMYYWATREHPQQHIAASIWTP